MEEEIQQQSIATNVVMFLTESMRKVDSMVIPLLDDDDINGIPTLLEEAKKRRIAELTNESIAWNIGGQIMIIDYTEELKKFLEDNEIKFITFDKVDEENFDKIKGRIKNSIVGEILALTRTEEATISYATPPGVKS